MIFNLINQAEAHGRPTESAFEARVARYLQGIDGLVRQHQIFDLTGAFVARVDFAVPAARLAIEAHSRQFHFWPGAVSRDEPESTARGNRLGCLLYRRQDRYRDRHGATARSGGSFGRRGAS